LGSLLLLMRGSAALSTHSFKHSSATRKGSRRALTAKPTKPKPTTPKAVLLAPRETFARFCGGEHAYCGGQIRFKDLFDAQDG